MVKTDVNNLHAEIMKTLNNYQEDIQEDVEQSVDQITKAAQQELKQVSLEKFGNSGRKTPYYKGWTVKVSTRGKSKYNKVIWNKTNYQLTHLLEFGHRVWNAKNKPNVSERPHIRPVEEKYKVEFVDLLERKIGGAK